MMDNYLYVFICDGFYKIGVTANVSKRLSSIQTMNPHNVELALCVRMDNPRPTEKMFHSFFRKENHVGEWFILSQEDFEVMKCLVVASYNVVQEPVQYGLYMMARDVDFFNRTNHQSTYQKELAERLIAEMEYQNATIIRGGQTINRPQK